MISNDMIIQTVVAVLSVKVQNIVEQGWEGWDGVIHAFGRNFKISITELKNDK